MLSRSFSRWSSTLSQLESLLASRNFSEVSKQMCQVRPGEVSSWDWSKFIDSILRVSEPSIIPAALVSTSSMGHTIREAHKKRIIEIAISGWDNSLSIFDKVVILISISQTGLRTPESVDLFNRFLLSRAEVASIPQKFFPSIMLAAANFGLNNPQGWNNLISQLDVPACTPHELANVTLAIATSRTFPIALLERLMDAAIGIEIFCPDDAVTILHALSCLELFRVDLFRKLFNSIDRVSSHQKVIMKQILLSILLDPKADEVWVSAAPKLWDRLAQQVDWSVPEPKRHHTLVAGEIQAILGQLGSGDSVDSINSTITVPSAFSSWNRHIAVQVAMHQFYLSDVDLGDGINIFVDIDDETFVDLQDGPIDPFIQIKHAQIRRCGWKLLWVRELEWTDDLTEDEKLDIVRNSVS